MSTPLLHTYLPSGPALIVTVGFPDEPDERLKRSPQSVLVDLDQVDCGAEPIEGPSGVVALYARSFTDLRRAVTLSNLLPEASHFIIAVAESSRFRLVGLPSAAPNWPTIHRVHAYQHPVNGWAIEFRLRKRAPVVRFLADTARSINDHRSKLVPQVAIAGPGAAQWRPGDPGTILTSRQGPLSPPDQYLPADVVLRATDTSSPEWTDSRVVALDRPTYESTRWDRLTNGAVPFVGTSPEFIHTDSIPPVDEISVNPFGFVARDTKGVGELSQLGSRWVITAPSIGTVTVPDSGALTDADVQRLRQLRGISIDWGRHTSPISAIRTVASLAMAGVPLLAPRRAPEWASALGTELTEALHSIDEDELEDDIRREEHSIRLRRAAFGAHSSSQRWRNLAAEAKVSVRPPATVSVILCTRRPEFIPFALAQIARQRGPEFEVILVLHGLPETLPHVDQAIQDFPKPLSVIRVPDDVVFGEALNRGAEAATGDFVTKWDDDDWYSPDHLGDMLMAAAYSNADLVGCVHQYIYLEQINLTVFRPSGEPERLSRHIAGGTLLIDRHTFNEVGRFRGLPRQEDRSVLLAVEAAGGLTYRTHGLGYVLHRRPAGHTWNQPITHFLRNSARQWPGFRPSRLLELDDLRNRLANMKGPSPYDV